MSRWKCHRRICLVPGQFLLDGILNLPFITFSTSILTLFQKQRCMVKINAKREKFQEKTNRLHKQLLDNPLGEFMTLERETILALEIDELVQKLKSDELDPVAVLEAYQVSFKITAKNVQKSKSKFLRLEL